MYGYINTVERDIHGAWLVFGLIGMKKYHCNTESEARARYNKDCNKLIYVGA